MPALRGTKEDMLDLAGKRAKQLQRSLEFSKAGVYDRRESAARA